jgi:hypothetical protein
MGRKSDKTKEKEKPCPEKKPEKTTRRSHRHSRRRKRSSSVSERVESAAEENETSLKSSQAGTEEEEEDEEGKDKGEKEAVNEGNTDAKEKDDEIPKVSTSRRSSKKQASVVEGGAKTQDTSPSDDEWKEDKSFWEGEQGTVSISRQSLPQFPTITCLSPFHCNSVHRILLTQAHTTENRTIFNILTFSTQNYTHTF